MGLLEVVDVSKVFPGVRALDDVTFTLSEDGGKFTGKFWDKAGKVEWKWNGSRGK